MPRYLVTLGSSHAHGVTYIKEATLAIQRNKDIHFVSTSRIYKNSSTHTYYNHLFVNCALALSTTLHPHAFYRELHAIEHHLGRIRSRRNAPRTIDIDVLLSLDLVYISAHFFVPHKAAWERNFFVIPALEALKLAGWPRPIGLMKSGLNFGTAYLEPFTSI